jgi:CDP-glucose 4,6-dehydratase
MSLPFWSAKRVFVTGHTGFKGGWLCGWLLDAGADVAGYALTPTTERTIIGDACLEPEMSSTIGDVRDRARLEGALRKARPEIVMHLAAQPLVGRSYENPVETFDVNVVGTAHVLDAVRALPSVRAVVVVTSDKCYDQRQPARRHTEDDPLGGGDPYSASKACAEFVTSSFRGSYFAGSATGVATARAGNVIGGGDDAKDRLVPDLLRAFERGVPARIRRPDAVRPWQHVVDPIAGYVRLAQALYEDPERFSGAWNFGPPADRELQVAELADMAAAAWGRGASWTPAAGSHPPEREVLRLDSAKAARELQWSARVPLDAAVAATIEWYRKRTLGADMRALLRHGFSALAQAVR